jgi:hypothetical protein
MYAEHWFPAETLERLDEDHTDITNTRDILEHFDEYIMGTGNLQGGRRRRRRDPRQSQGMDEQTMSERVDHDPIQVAFDEGSGRLTVRLSSDKTFEVNLSALQDDLAHMVIDFIVDIDALEDEPHLFDDDHEGG